MAEEPQELLRLPAINSSTTSSVAFVESLLHASAFAGQIWQELLRRLLLVVPAAAVALHFLLWWGFFDFNLKEGSKLFTIHVCCCFG